MPDAKPADRGPTSLGKVYLIRHGQTEWSLSRRHTGNADIDLTERGAEETVTVGRAICGTSFTRTFTSPLVRAKRTAEIAGYSDTIVLPELREWNYGKYEGLTTKEIQQDRPNWNVFIDGAPDGEMPGQISARADAVIARIWQEEGTVALFSHAHFLRVLAVRWLGLPVEAGRFLMLDTAYLSILGFEHHSADEPAIRLWNSRCV
jgi:broad specificity phosphatase PhoE